jgi:hypothetical protein
MSPRFLLGEILMTANASAYIPPPDVEAALQRHAQSDPQDAQLLVQPGIRLLSAYRASNGVKFWTITEADRSLTTVLLPEDY